MIYTDQCFKNYGIKFLMLNVLYFTVFLFVLYASIVIVLKSSGSDLGAALFCFILSIFVLAQVSFSSFIERKVVKLFQLVDHKIIITKYIGKQIQLNLSEVDCITNINKKFIMRFMRLFEGDLEGFEIKSGNKIFYITPHMERFDELKAKLIEIAECNKSQSPS